MSRALDHLPPTVRIEFVRAKPARVTGAVASASGRSIEGDAKGIFEIPRVPPGSYELTSGRTARRQLATPAGEAERTASPAIESRSTTAPLAIFRASLPGLMKQTPVGR